MLEYFFYISTGFRYKKMEKSSPSIYRDVHGLGKNLLFKSVPAHCDQVILLKVEKLVKLKK